MYYRITTMSTTPDGVGVMMSYADSVRDRLSELNTVSLNTIDAGNGKMVIVAIYNSKADADDIFGGMARAGKITEPGRGFMYSIPVRSGLINVSSTVSSSAHGANMEQIISALDDLKGDKDWRTAADTGKSKALKTTFLENLVGLYCIVPRDYYEEVYDAVLDAGAPGVSTNFGVMLDAGERQDHLTEEWALVYTSVGSNKVDSLREKLTEKLSVLGIDRFAFYSLPIPRALTYLGG